MDALRRGTRHPAVGTTRGEVSFHEAGWLVPAAWRAAPGFPLAGRRAISLQSDFINPARLGWVLASFAHRSGCPAMKILLLIVLFVAIASMSVLGGRRLAADHRGRISPGNS
jgi:hypothetical protein